MSDNEIKEKIMELISRKDEGSYYDYKTDFHEDNGKLVHDILCLVNNTGNQESYIIFGVEDQTGEIVGIENSQNRKSRQNIIDLLKGVEFVSGIRPTVDLIEFEIGVHNVCVLVIKKSSDVPFYLTKKYRSVNQYQIYTRVGDTNTPITSQADINDIEKLWKIRFGIIPNPFERVVEYIKNVTFWKSQKPKNTTSSWYYENHPEFTIIMTHDPESESLRNPSFTTVQINASSGWLNIQVKYHQTALMEYNAFWLDNTRGIAVYPKVELINNMEEVKKRHFSTEYLYYYINSPELLLSEFLNFQFGGERCKDLVWPNHLSYVLILSDEKEKLEFNAYLQDNISGFQDDFNTHFDTTYIGVNSGLSSEDMDFTRGDMAFSKTAVSWLERFRNRGEES